jgi:D-arginine dehydrogenase
MTLRPPQGYRCDVAVIGAGMAGASLAAALVARGASVLVAEAEDMPGYHATGRSAAFWTESYGGPGVQPLTTASGPLLTQLGVLRERGALTIARAGREAELERFMTRFACLGVRVERVDRAGLEARVPGIRCEWIAGALEPDCCDIDVAALHQHYLATARQGGAEILRRAGLVSAVRGSPGWHLQLAEGSTVHATTLVNAAGAWADGVAAMAGAEALGIRPLRRTIAQVRVEPAAGRQLPLVLDLDEQFYFKPEAGRLWLSPHDETPALPGDAAPDEIDVALAIERLQSVVDWRVAAVERKWAGLRSFALDRLPVYGWDRNVPGFFWFAGQGGFGIQTAPAAAELAARLLAGDPPGAVDPAPYAPGRPMRWQGNWPGSIAT